MQLKRAVPVRVSFVFVSVLVYAGTLYAIGALDYEATVAEKVLDSLEGLLMTLGVAIIGDTWRPSGAAVASHKVEAIMQGAPPSR